MPGFGRAFAFPATASAAYRSTVRLELASAIRRVSREHAAIVQAPRDRDADAAEAAMRTHLRAVEHSIFGSRD